jgi:hypothetical protein
LTAQQHTRQVAVLGVLELIQKPDALPTIRAKPAFITRLS